MGFVQPRQLFDWCVVPYSELATHPQRRVPFRLCADSKEMGRLMARELVDEIQLHNGRGELRAPSSRAGRLLVRAVHRPGEP